jgi:hypothetical protein
MTNRRNDNDHETRPSPSGSGTRDPVLTRRRCAWAMMPTDGLYAIDVLHDDWCALPRAASSVPVSRRCGRGDGWIQTTEARMTPDQDQRRPWGPVLVPSRRPAAPAHLRPRPESERARLLPFPSQAHAPLRLEYGRASRDPHQLARWLVPAARTKTDGAIWTGRFHCVDGPVAPGGAAYRSRCGSERGGLDSLERLERRRTLSRDAMAPLTPRRALAVYVLYGRHSDANVSPRSRHSERERPSISATGHGGRPPFVEASAALLARCRRATPGPPADRTQDDRPDRSGLAPAEAILRQWPIVAKGTAHTNSIVICTVKRPRQ